MEETTQPADFGSALDGKVFTTENEAVKAELEKGVNLDVAIGSAVMAYNNNLKMLHGDPLPEMAEITVTEKNKADYPQDFELAQVGDKVAVPFGKLALYY